jgi:hypothetical protein
MMASFHEATDQTRMTSRMSSDWITNLFTRPDMLLMGHHQRAEDHNLGTGWLY